MSRELTFFGKVAASRKVFGKLTNNCEQFVNAFVDDERCCSALLPLQQAKKPADAVLKADDLGKDEVIVSDVLSSSVNESECLTKALFVHLQNFCLIRISPLMC